METIHKALLTINPRMRQWGWGDLLELNNNTFTNNRLSAHFTVLQLFTKCPFSASNWRYRLLLAPEGLKHELGNKVYSWACWPCHLYQNNNTGKGPAWKIPEFCFNLYIWILTRVLRLHSSTFHEYIKGSTCLKIFQLCIQIFLSLSFSFSLLSVEIRLYPVSTFLTLGKDQRVWLLLQWKGVMAWMPYSHPAKCFTSSFLHQ